LNKSKEGFVIWLTGLPGSGKTTISRILEPRLTELGLKVEPLDGDEVRVWLSPGEAFTREDREKHLRRVAHICQLLSRNGVVVIAAFVSPYRTSRDYARSITPNFVEVFVKAPVELCMSRDPKGLYKKAKEGVVKNMTGVSDPYEEPWDAEIVVDTSHAAPETSAEEILAKLRELGFVP
jgi:adenylylsulfate kinase